MAEKNIVGVVILYGIALMIGSSFIGSIITSITDANLTGFALVMWGLLTGLYGLAMGLGMLKAVGIKF